MQINKGYADKVYIVQITIKIECGTDGTVR